MIGRCHFGPSSALIRKSCLEAVGLFDATLRSVEDRDLWIRLASRFTLAKLASPLLFYRMHSGSLSNKSAQMERYERQVLDKAFAQIPRLRGHWMLRRQTYSQAAYTSAPDVSLQRASRLRLCRRMLWSFLYWPLPLPGNDDGGRLVRAKVVANLLLRMLSLRGPEPLLAGMVVATPPPLPVRSKRDDAKPDCQTLEPSLV